MHMCLCLDCVCGPHRECCIERHLFMSNLWHPIHNRVREQQWQLIFCEAEMGGKKERKGAEKGKRGEGRGREGKEESRGEWWRGEKRRGRRKGLFEEEIKQ